MSRNLVKVWRVISENTGLTDTFADIRPYRDNEVPAVVQRLVVDPGLLDALARLRLGIVARWAPDLVRPLVRWVLARQLRGITDVSGVQAIIKRYMDKMIERSTDGFTVSGLDALDPDRAYLFVSNHRDIAMDPAFTNYALYGNGFGTARIAIGDNLLTRPWVSDLMRLNKSFIVRRSVSGPRQLLAASRTLSQYIQHSVVEEKVSVWIAQREGRAKNGVDRTEPVIIKMLSMSRDKSEQSFAQHIESLNIVPVAISYELDPCDALKANELQQLATTGHYEKAEQEDVASIGQGIAGDKGRVHISFGTPLGGNLETPEAVAAEIDRQVISGYCLHPTNLFAYRRLYGADAPLPDNVHVEAGGCSETRFMSRIDAMPEAHRNFALGIYANAVCSKIALTDGSVPPC